MTEQPLAAVHKKLVDYIAKVCEANDSWFNAHVVASASLWATGDLTESLTAEIKEFADYLEADDIGVEVTPAQYLTAAIEFCDRKVVEWDTAEDKVAAFENAHWILSGAEQYGLDRSEATAALLNRKPEWLEPACAWLLDGDEAEETTWEEVLASPALRSAIRPQLIAKAPEINAVWNEGSDEPFDWWGLGEDVVSLMAEAGVPSQSKERHDAFIAEQQRQSEIRVAEQKAQAEAAARTAVKPSDPEVRYPAGVFQDALDNCFFDNIFAEAEQYKDLILLNIDEIAGNFCEGNEFKATGEEPQWLLSALLKAGART